MNLTRKIASCLLVAFLAVPALADFDLQITEIWMGNDPGEENVTPDWFEVTNFGDSAFETAVHGDLFYDDESFDVTTADPLMGVSVIGAGESVVFVDGDDGTNANVDLFESVWGAVIGLPQVGSYEGSGLGQGGDAVGIWIGTADGTPDFSGAYPDATFAMGGSYDLINGAFSVAGVNSAVATLAVNDIGQPGIGSPGVVPEPAMGLMVLLGLGLIIARRR